MSLSLRHILAETPTEVYCWRTFIQCVTVNADVERIGPNFAMQNMENGMLCASWDEDLAHKQVLPEAASHSYRDLLADPGDQRTSHDLSQHAFSYNE